MKFKFTGINHTTLLVKDKVAAYDFYHNILGFEKYNKTKSLWLVAGNQFIHISDTSGSPVDRGFYHFATVVKNFKSYLSFLQTKDVKLFVLDNTGELAVTSNVALILSKQQVFVKDLDGNLLEFLDEVNEYFNAGNSLT